ncbi:DUF4097 family beta strand repeat-containing protein [Moorena bouillonii]|uniref:DUF4097 domain-containing protein n=1 Tax=Moorena bouillonii PNG TaxID=568701 RepID=A0A1U7N0Y6_9CYAN|nr:DUF4097 family beta strand repeat-containing protein [Moorena bouillonii]ANM28710.1 hypothetical protein ABI59_02430 [Acidobacteria bacterium Mor1]OLT59618.1 hypothetical protein BJP37_11860 [Moorena bouillonii PNG]
MRRLPLLLTILAVLLCGPTLYAGDPIQRSVEGRVALPPGSTLELENLLGSIQVEGDAPAGEALLEATVIAEHKDPELARSLAESIAFRIDGTRVQVTFPVDRHTTFRLPRAERGGLISRWVTPLLKKDTVTAEYDGRMVELGNVRKAPALAVHLRVRLPRDSRAALRQAVGSIDCARFRGDLSLTNAAGAVRVQQFYGTLDARSARGTLDVRTVRGGQLSLQTGTGDLMLADVQTGSVSLQSGEGSIEATDIKAEQVEARSSEGAIVLYQLEPGQLAVESAGGDIELESTLKYARSWQVESRRGDVELRLGRYASFALTTRTAGNGFAAEGLELEQVGQDSEGTHWQHKRGGPRLAVAAGGKVTLRSQ